MNIIHATLRLVLLLAVGGLLSLSAEADQDTDAVKRQIKMATEGIIRTVNKGLLDANEEAKKSLTEALNLLEGLDIDLMLAQRKGVAKDTINQLTERVKARKNFFKQTMTRGDRRYDVSEWRRFLKERYDKDAQKQKELRDLSNKILELRKQGKFKEALDLAQKRSEKAGQTPSEAILASIAAGKVAFDKFSEIKVEDRKQASELEKQMMLACLPAENKSEIEFPSPEKWKTLTKGRAEVKLSEAEAKLLKALQTPIKEDLKAQSLTSVLDTLQRKYGVTCNLDREVLGVLRIPDDVPVNLKAENTALRTVLTQMLAETGLVYFIRKGELHITTPDRAAAQMVLRTYYLGDLLVRFNQPFEPFRKNQLAALQALMELIELIQNIEPQTWQSAGGAGKIMFNPSLLSFIIRQSAETHYQLQGALR